MNVERAEQERYQLLPEWTREELAEWMTGRSEQLVDGEHRQGQSWTNLGVATLIAAELGIGRNVHVGDGKKYSRPRVLTPDGFIVDLETSYSGLSDYWVPGLIAAGRTLGNPASLFNAGRPDGYDISKLPAIFRDAREELRSQGDVLLINDKYERPTKSSDGPNPFLFIALLLLVDAVLGVILLVNGLSS